MSYFYRRYVTEDGNKIRRSQSPGHVYWDKYSLLQGEPFNTIPLPLSFLPVVSQFLKRAEGRWGRTGQQEVG